MIEGSGRHGRAIHVAKVDQDNDRENAVVKAQIKRLKEEGDILKKAAAYFAKDPW